MKIKSAELETVCGITSKFPDNECIELAFIGRSNVGKSSLINTLLNRKGLARTSSSPGKTQTINYYKVNDEFYFVDLPGYGFAKVAIKVKEQWQKMIGRYLKSSRSLRVVFQLMDIRHKPSVNDVEMYGWLLGNGFNPVIIATKADKVKKSQREGHIRQIEEGLGVIEGTPVIPYSSLNKEGREDVLEYVEAFVSELEV